MAARAARGSRGRRLRRFEPINSIGWIVGHMAWHEQRYWLTRVADETPEPILNEVAASGGPMTTPSLKAMLKAWGVVPSGRLPIAVQDGRWLTLGLPRGDAVGSRASTLARRSSASSGRGWSDRRDRLAIDPPSERRPPSPNHHRLAGSDDAVQWSPALGRHEQEARSLLVVVPSPQPPRVGIRPRLDFRHPRPPRRAR
jgi:hypothetical protein